MRRGGENPLLTTNLNKENNMDFSKLPLNTQRSYVFAKDKSGTEIWIPTFTRDNTERALKRKALEDFLDTQPEPDFKA